jgi:hypothetical protein
MQVSQNRIFQRLARKPARRIAIRNLAQRYRQKPSAAQN